MATTATTAAQDTGTPLWIDLLEPTHEQIAEVTRRCRLEVPTRAALEEIETSSRLRGDEHALYLSLPLATHREPGGLLPLPLGFVLTPEVLVTIRYGEVKALAQVQERFRATPPKDSGEAFATLVEALVDVAADLLESLGGQLTQLSTRIFREAGTRDLRDKRFARSLRRELGTVGVVGDDLSQLRQTLLGLQRMIGFVAERAIGGLAPELQKRLHTAGQDVSSLVDYELHLTDKAQFLLDAVLGYITTEQNDIFRVLTIVSIAGIPPTLIASLYGMNFHAMPELSWPFGYPFALLLIVASAALPLAWFKRRGWW